MTWHRAVTDSHPSDLSEEATRLKTQMEQGIARLITLVANDAGLQQIVNTISDMFGLPATIIDNNFSYLAISDDYAGVFAVFGDDLNEGHVPLRIQKRLKHSEIFHPSTIRTDPVYFDTRLPDDTIRRNYTTLVYLRHVPVASFSIFTNGEEIPQVELRYLPMIASLLSLEMQKSSFYLLNKVTFYRHLLARLLDDSTAIDDETFRLRFAVFGYKLGRFKQVVLIDLSGEDFPAAGVQSFADSFHSHLPDSVYFIHDGDVVYLTSSPEYAPIRPEDAEVWQKDISETKMRIGISSVFDTVSQFTRALKQAKAAIETGLWLGVPGRVLWFDHYRLADLVRRVPKDVDVSSYVFPPLLRVIDHDHEHGSQLTYTLSRYLLNPTCPKTVCQELFIHKNTLYYRLNQLRELMQVDLDAADVRAQIHISFLILRSQNRLSFPAEAMADTAA